MRDKRAFVRGIESDLVKLEELQRVVGQTIYLFGRIESAVDTNILFLLSDKCLHRHLSRLKLTQKIDVFCDLAKAADKTMTEEIKSIRERAKSCVGKRNIVAHGVLIGYVNLKTKRETRSYGKVEKAISLEELAACGKEAIEVLATLICLHWRIAEVRWERNKLTKEN